MLSVDLTDSTVHLVLVPGQLTVQMQPICHPIFPQLTTYLLMGWPYCNRIKADGYFGKCLCRTLKLSFTLRCKTQCFHWNIWEQILLFLPNKVEILFHTWTILLPWKYRHFLYLNSHSIKFLFQSSLSLRKKKKNWQKSVFLYSKTCCYGDGYWLHTITHQGFGFFPCCQVVLKQIWQTDLYIQGSCFICVMNPRCI